MATRLKAFLAGHEKIHILDVHPTQPWVVTADEADSVVVWNWEHRQILYQVNAAGVDVRRVIDTQLQKLAGESDAALGAEGLKGGSVTHVKFYDDDVRFWTAWKNRAAASELSITESAPQPPITPCPPALRGRRFLVTCSLNKAVFLDLVTMKARDVPKAALDNKAPLCVEFLPKTTGSEGPFAAFGGPDGAIRVLSMATWQPFKRLTGGHKNAVSCMLTYATSQGETQLVTGGSDGSLVFWNLDSGVSTVKDGGPRLALNKVHDGGVLSISLARMVGAAPQLITTGVDKSLAIFDTMTLKEMRRIKQTIGKLACHSVCAWSHPRAPTFESLVAGKDPNLWGVDRGTGARPLVDLNKFVPPSAVPQGKKLKIYSMLVHPLQPQLVILGTNAGIALLEFDSKAIPAAAALPTPSGGKEHTVVYSAQREMRALTFSLGSAARRSDDPNSPTKAMAGGAAEASAVRQSRKRLASALYEENAKLAASPSGNYVSVRWPGQNSYAIYNCRNWSVVDSGAARFFAWDTVRDRYSILPAVAVQRPQLPTKGSSKKKAEAAAAAQAAAAAAAAAAASATVEVREILADGSAVLLCKAIDGRKESVVGLHGGALLGVAFRITVARERVTSAAALISSAQGAYQAAAAGGGVAPSSVGAGPDDNAVFAESPPNFQLYSWETFKPVSGLLPQPEWSAWDAGVEYCALVYKAYVVICAARPSFRSLGSVAISGAVSGVWHRRQFFVATPTTIEVVFVDSGIDPELEEKRLKKKQEEEDKKSREKADPNTLALAVLTVDAPQTATPKSTLKARPPLLQVVRLASFATPPAAPAVARPKTEEIARSPLAELDGSERKMEVAIAGGGQSAAASRLPPEQRRPVGPLVVVGVREGVLWLVDRYFTAHALALSHPGIRCRCLAAYGDAVSAVKWAARLGREHHDDLATFMVGMGYAKEALHLPGLSKRLEFDLAMQCNELQRALRVLLELSNSKEAPPEPLAQTAGLDVGLTLLALEQKQASLTEAVAGTARFASEFLAIIDAADATGQKDIALAALKRLAVAGEVEGALKAKEHRALSLRLASHGERARLAVQSNALISAGQGREAALAAALLGDPNLIEKAFADTGLFPEAALHAHQHGRVSSLQLIQDWNKTLQKQLPGKPGKLQTPGGGILSAKKSPSLRPPSATAPLVEVVAP